MAADDVVLTDLEVIAQFSLAVRAATAPRADVVAALEADLAALTGDRPAPRRAAPRKAARAGEEAAPRKATPRTGEEAAAPRSVARRPRTPRAEA